MYAHKPSRLLLVLVMIVSILGMIGISRASATPSPKFNPYHATVTWYKSGGTLASIWPQNDTVIGCGGITQVDTYDINTSKEDTDFKDLLKGHILNSPSDDAEFHPHDYAVSVLPTCADVPLVVVVAPTCDTDGSLVIPANGNVKWLVNGSQVDGGAGGILGVGTYTISAHTVVGYLFTNGDHSVTFNKVVLAKTGGCVTDTPPVNSCSVSNNGGAVTDNHCSHSDVPSVTPDVTPMPTLSTSTTPAPSASVTVDQTPAAKTSQLATTGTSHIGELILVAFVLLMIGSAIAFFTRRSGRREI